MEEGNTSVRRFLSEEEHQSLKELCPLDRVVSVGLAGWSRNFDKLPSTFSIDTIQEYLVSTGRVVDKEDSVNYSMKAFRDCRSSLGYKSFHAGNVVNCQFNVMDSNPHFSLLHAFVAPSQSVEKRPYRTIVVIHKETGRPCMASCECTARMRENCSHAAAVLFQALAYNRKAEINEAPACTDLPCSWIRPGKLKVDPKPIADIVIKKAKFGAKPSRKRVSGEAKYYCDAVPPMTDSEFQTLLGNMQQVNPTCPFSTHFGNLLANPVVIADKPSSEDKILPPSVMENCKTVDEAHSSSRHVAQTLSNFRVFAAADENDTVRQLREIEAHTSDDSSRETWLESRKGLITASMAYEVIRKRESTKPDRLIEKIKGSSACFDVPAMKVGRDLEGSTCVRAVSKIQTQLQAHISMRKCGLVRNPKWEFLGATPDRELTITYSDGSIDVVPLEVKSPTNQTHNGPFPGGIMDLYEQRKPPYFSKNNEGELSLKIKSLYGIQVQMQLALTESDYGYFAIATETDIWCERIEFDKIMWDNELFPKLKAFNDTYLK